MKITQEILIKKFFKNNPNRNIKHPEIVDCLTKEYFQKTGKIFRDPDRVIRQLYQKGFLIKINKGIYKYDPKIIKNNNIENFSENLKKQIKKRDNYKCVICGKGLINGVELHIDHIKPKKLGGKALIENGQTLCSQHNFLKKTMTQTEVGKKMFIKLYETLKIEKNKKLLIFCNDILNIFEKYNIDTHIKWKK